MNIPTKHEVNDEVYNILQTLMIIHWKSDSLRWGA